MVDDGRVFLEGCEIIINMLSWVKVDFDVYFFMIVCNGLVKEYCGFYVINSLLGLLFNIVKVKDEV